MNNYCISCKITTKQILYRYISICYVCYNKVPQTEWLTQQRLIVSRFLSKKCKIKVSAGLVLSERCEEGSISCLSLRSGRFLTIFGVPSLVQTSPWSLPSFSHVILSLCTCVLFMRTPTTLGQSPPQRESAWVASVKALSSNKVAFWSAGGSNFNIWICRDTSPNSRSPV